MFDMRLALFRDISLPQAFTACAVKRFFSALHSPWRVLLVKLVSHDISFVKNEENYLLSSVREPQVASISAHQLIQQ